MVDAAKASAALLKPGLECLQEATLRAVAAEGPAEIQYSRRLICLQSRARFWMWARERMSHPQMQACFRCALPTTSWCEACEFRIEELVSTSIQIGDQRSAAICTRCDNAHMVCPNCDRNGWDWARANRLAQVKYPPHELHVVTGQNQGATTVVAYSAAAQGEGDRQVTYFNTGAPQISSMGGQGGDFFVNGNPFQWARPAGQEPAGSGRRSTVSSGSSSSEPGDDAWFIVGMRP